ncbi:MULTISPECIES: hypothetical protein [Sediminimonas]|uniref:hypothetical protein n=1 Tax=Sediminimonas TaxID=659427 RepID=UPI00041ED045|nr:MULTISPECIES: hypothetical protein [Sediminimonas]MDR9483635.1 hypothetical protein [Sediminimonas sp.]
MTSETGPDKGPQQTEAPEVMARVGATGMRRLIGVGMLVVLGGAMLYIALASPPQETGWQVFLLVVGGGALILSESMRRATRWQLELTETGLRMSDGTVVAPLDMIEGIERGMFAFKPSNGFTLRLSEPLGRQWLPGLWWRVGRRVGVGGVTPRPQTKFMADTLQALLAERGTLG